MTSADEERSDAPAPSSLAHTAARGAAVTAAGQGVRVGLQLVGLVVLARLLSPSDYGLFAMVVLIIGVGEVFRDFGLSSAAVQAPTLSIHQRNNLFWVNTGIGVTLCLSTVAGAPLIAAVYDEPRLVPLATLLSVTFLASGATTQYRADLNRQLRFTTLVVADVGGQVVGLVVGVTTALAGWGYYALAAMSLTQATLGLVAMAIGCGWIPGRPRRDVPMRAFFRYGAGLVAAQLLGYGAKSTDSIVIGASLGATPLGLYSRAFQIMSLPQQVQAPATRIALPLLARVQDDPQRFGDRLVRAQGLLLHATAVSVAVPAAVAPSLFAIVLGAEWVPAAPVFQVLAVGSFATMASYACYWVFLARGLTASMFRFSLWARPLTILALVVGVHWGLYGVAIAYSAVNLLLWPLHYWWLARITEMPTRALMSNGARVVTLYGGASVAAVIASHLLPVSTSEPVRLVAGLLVMAATLTLASTVSAQVRAEFRSLRAVALLLTPARSQGATVGG